MYAAANALPGDETRDVNCPDARTRASLPPGTRLPPECEQLYRTNPDASGMVPITPGRDLGVGTTKDWNVWVDANFINTSDGRYGLDVIAWSRTGTIGVDRRITNNFVLGLYASLEDSQTGGYGGFFSATTRGPTIGPYAALMLSDNWAIDASLGYSRLSNTLRSPCSKAHMCRNGSRPTSTCTPSTISTSSPCGRG